jgi:DNA-binding response OmpR family regulator
MMKKPVALIMEDDHDEQKSIKLALESAGFEVMQVYDYFNARKLMRRIEEGDVDLMLCDGVIMEDLDKPKELVKTTHLVRQARKANPTMLMIAMSNDEDLRNEHFAFGEMISPGHNLIADKKDLVGCFSSLKRSS